MVRPVASVSSVISPLIALFLARDFSMLDRRNMMMVRKQKILCAWEVSTNHLHKLGLRVLKDFQDIFRKRRFKILAAFHSQALLIYYYPIFEQQKL